MICEYFEEGIFEAGEESQLFLSGSEGFHGAHDAVDDGDLADGDDLGVYSLLKRFFTKTAPAAAIPEPIIT